MKNDSLISGLKWIFFVSRRFSRVDHKGRSAVTSFLASLGICFGVMTLIVVISVMNGFQMGFIDAIMEISSYHIRVSSIPSDKRYEFSQFCKQNNAIKTAIPFYEAQSLMVGDDGNQNASLIRAVPDNICNVDKGFRNQLHMIGGIFDVSENHIVLGSYLAQNLGVRVGSEVNLFALSGGKDVDLLSNDRKFVVSGVFSCGYSDINHSYAFISIKNGQNYFGKSAKLIYGIKLVNSAHDSIVISEIVSNFPSVKSESWRIYNRTFFGALRIEKNILMLLVFLIFVVVGINIFNGMRRLVYERRPEISVLSALGGKSIEIQFIFIMRGFLTGVIGAIPGLCLGLLISTRIDYVFRFVARAIYEIQYFFTMLIFPSNAGFIRENTMYLVYAGIPARINFNEILIITIFGMFSALLASWAAGRNVLKITVAEVLRDE